MKQYCLHGFSGLVELRKTRQGPIVGIYNSDQGGVDEAEEGRWSTVCEGHGVSINHSDYDLAREEDPATGYTFRQPYILDRKTKQRVVVGEFMKHDPSWMLTDDDLKPTEINARRLKVYLASCDQEYGYCHGISGDDATAYLLKEVLGDPHHRIHQQEEIRRLGYCTAMRHEERATKEFYKSWYKENAPGYVDPQIASDMAGAWLLERGATVREVRDFQIRLMRKRDHARYTELTFLYW